MPLPGLVVTYVQQDCFGNWQNTTNITNSEGVAGFIAFDVPLEGFINYSEAKIYVSNIDCPEAFEAESQWFCIYENIL